MKHLCDGSDDPFIDNIRRGPERPGIAIQHSCLVSRQEHWHVCLSDEGDGSSLAVMGYNPQDGIYANDPYNGIADAEHAKGVLNSETWIWTLTPRLAPRTTRVAS
jgi:hypothetical protein